MNKTALHLILAAAIATVAIVPAAAHAEPAGGGSSGGSQGKSCDDDGRTVEDGYVGTYKTKYERGSVTCSNGTLCTSRGVLQGDNKTRVWFYECKDANGATYRTVKRCQKKVRWRCTAARIVKPATGRPTEASAPAGQGQTGTGPDSPPAVAINVATAHHGPDQRRDNHGRRDQADVAASRRSAAVAWASPQAEVRSTAVSRRLPGLTHQDIRAFWRAIAATIISA